MLRNYSYFVNAFNTICHLAETENIEKLSEFISSNGISINLSIDDRISPVAYLAQQNKSNAVELLLKHFHANINDAAYGYALSGLDDKVDIMINRGAIHLYAIFGYALSGNHDQIMLRYDNDDGKQFTANNYIPIFASFGYAISGRKELLMKVLRIDDDLYDKVILNEKNNLFFFYQGIGAMMRFSSNDLMEYFEREYIESNVPEPDDLDYNIQFNQLLNQDTDCRDNRVVMAPSDCEITPEYDVLLMFFLYCGFTKELHDRIDKGVRFHDGIVLGYLTKGSPELLNLLIEDRVNVDRLVYSCFNGRLLENADDILKILSIIDDDQIRQQFAICMLRMEPRFANIEMKTLLVYAEKINQLMQSCYLSYPHALAVVENDALTWLTEGRQVCKQREKNLNAEHPLPILPLDVYKEISKHVLNQNIMETQLIIKKLQNHQLPSKVGIFKSSDEAATCHDVPETVIEPPLMTCNIQ